jgi:hypothetical protein
MKRWISVALLCLTAAGPLYPQAGQLQPGVDRWSIKTSLITHPTKVTMTIDELLALPNPIDKEEAKYDTTRIAKTVGPHAVREGEMVTTTAWLHLVAMENDNKTHRDGDYHIQIRNSPDWADSCLVIEVPLPKFISDPNLAAACAKVRELIKTKILAGKEPGTAGNKLSHPVYVTVTGQLFFDATHLKGNPRGKRGMKSYTPWELHPIISLSFAAKPK